MKPTNTQINARQRNFLKMRLAGLTFYQVYHPNITTDREREMLKKIEDIKRELLENWDENSLDLGFNIRTRTKRNFLYDKDI